MESGEVGRTVSEWSTSSLQRVFSCLLRSPAVLNSASHLLQLLVVDGKEVVVELLFAEVFESELKILDKLVAAMLFLIEITIVELVVGVELVVVPGVAVLELAAVWPAFLGVDALGLVVIGHVVVVKLLVAGLFVVAVAVV